MADRSRLHISKLEDFKEWLVKDGWKIEEPKGTWEVLRARKAGRQNPLIVYTKMNAKEHLSVMDRDSGVIGAYLRDCKKPKTNADRIRSMTDEELAEFIFSQARAKCSSHDCVGADTCYYHADWNSGECDGCNKAILKWLQSDSEV